MVVPNICKKLVFTVYPYKVSILIPSYNKHTLILQCVESALNQDYRNLEIIVSDESENRMIRDALEEYISKSIIKYHHHNPKLGRLDNYKKLLHDYSSGDWILMMDGDDFLTDNRYISAAMDWISKQDQQIVYVRARHSVDRITNPSTHLNFESISGTDYIRNPFIYCSEFSHLTSIYNRRLAIESDFYDFNDLYGFLILASKGKVGLCNATVGVWRNFHDSESKSLKEKDVANIFGMFNNVDSKLLTFFTSKMLHRYRLYYYLNYSLLLRTYAGTVQKEQQATLKSLAEIKDLNGKCIIFISKMLNSFLLSKFMGLIKLVS